MTVRALPVYPFPLEPDQLDALKWAKAELDLEYKIQPVAAAPGLPFTILAFEQLPPFLCTAALIKPGWTFESVKKALHAVLEGDGPFFDELSYLRALLGPGVREVEPEEVEQKVRFQ